MNNKLLSYDEAVKRLKDLESSQKFYKRILTKDKRPNELRALYQSQLILRKDKINTLLSLIDAHKRARKLYEEARYYKALALGKMVGNEKK